jgi:hypothetical protein
MEVVASETVGDRNDLRAASDWFGHRRPNICYRRFMPPTISKNERLLVAVVHREAVSPIILNESGRLAQTIGLPLLSVGWCRANWLTTRPTVVISTGKAVKVSWGLSES